MKKIVLASTSPRRIELMQKLGVPFVVEASGYEEDMSLELSPIELAKELSLGKALEVANRTPDSIIIGGDTFISIGEKVLGKPHTKERAKEMLKMLSGQGHDVLSGISVIDSSDMKTRSEVEVSKVVFREISDEEMDEYIATGEPLDRAGAYAIQGIAQKFVQHIEGDYDSILGLPVARLREILKDFGL